MKRWGIVLLVLVFFGIGILWGLTVFQGVNRGKPYDDRWLPKGTHQISAVVEVKSDYALVVLRSDSKEPRYYKIERKGVLNFEDISSVREVIKVDDDLKYIEFK